MGSLVSFGIVETTSNRRTSGCHSCVSVAESSSLHLSSYQKPVSRILTFSTCSHTAELVMTNELPQPQFIRV